MTIFESHLPCTIALRCVSVSGTLGDDSWFMKITQCSIFGYSAREEKGGIFGLRYSQVHLYVLKWSDLITVSHSRTPIQPNMRAAQDHHSRLYTVDALPC